MVALAVTWKARPGRDAEAAAIFSALTAASRQEPGCLMYLAHRHRSDSHRFFIYEQYRDDAALAAHRNSPHFLEYAKKQLPALADRLEGELYSPLE